jgi:hypothetical protein
MYVDNAGNQFESYSAACRYYGADTPEDCAAEAAYYEAEEWIAAQDAMEARGCPLPTQIVMQWGRFPGDGDFPF